jgi:hypothetical protein
MDYKSTLTAPLKFQTAIGCKLIKVIADFTLVVKSFTILDMAIELTGME